MFTLHSLDRFKLRPPRSILKNPLARKGAILNLLHIEFDENNPPGGSVRFVFSGGAELRLDIECLEVELADLGPVWDTTHCPAHGDDLRIA